jgi:hypothetical protein
MEMHAIDCIAIYYVDDNEDDDCDMSILHNTE